MTVAPVAVLLIMKTLCNPRCYKYIYFENKYVIGLVDKIFAELENVSQTKILILLKKRLSKNLEINLSPFWQTQIIFNVTWKN